MNRSALISTALSVVTLATLTGCGTGTSAESEAVAPSSADALTVVASTNVWGDIAARIGGDTVRVTSLISNPSQDPHSFEASASTALAITKADLVIENGGGYDDFVDQLLDAHHTEATVLNAVDLSGLTATEGDGLNEHVWYDLPSVQKVADAVAVELSRLAPANAATFNRNAAAFRSDLTRLTATEAQLREAHQGTPIGITEPVPLHLTEALGLVDRTPPAFSAAIEEGDDVSVSTLNTTLSLYRQHRVDLLVANAQTSGPITDQVVAAARTATIPVVEVTETLPAETDYVTWMQRTLDALGSALS